MFMYCGASHVLRYLSGIWTRIFKDSLKRKRERTNENLAPPPAD